MQEPSNFSAITSDMKDHFNVLNCFLNSAIELRRAASNGFIQESEGSISGEVNHFWNHHLVTSFFLFRHVIELGMKALIKEVTGKDVHGHDIEKLWKENIPTHETELSAEISKAFSVLKKFNVLNDAQLFRYHSDKSGKKLKDLPAIESDDFDALIGLAWKIRDAVLEVIDAKKDYPI